LQIKRRKTDAIYGLNISTNPLAGKLKRRFNVILRIFAHTTKKSDFCKNPKPGV